MGQTLSAQKQVAQEPHLYVFEALERGKLFKLKNYRQEVQGFANITKNGKGLLHHAVLQGQTKCLEYLLDCGLDVNRGDVAQNSPVLEIVQSRTKQTSNLEEMLLLLVKAGANINAVNSHKRTALMKSIIQFRHDISALLLKYGADPNIADIDGLLPIHVCATYSSLPLLEQILECRTNINAQDRKGRTALYFAVLSGHQTIVDKLLKHGADVNLGYPLQTAIVKCKLEALNVLLSHGASVQCVINEHRQALAKCKDYLNLALTVLSIELSAYQVAIQQENTDKEQAVSERLRFAVLITELIVQTYCGEANIAKNLFFKTKKPQFVDSLPVIPFTLKLKRLCYKLNFMYWLNNRNTTTLLEGMPKLPNSVKLSLENICRMKARKVVSHTGTNMLYVVENLPYPAILKDILLLRDV